MKGIWNKPRSEYVVESPSSNALLTPASVVSAHELPFLDENEWEDAVPFWPPSRVPAGHNDPIS